MADSIVELDSITKRYGSRMVLDGLSLRLEAGKLYTLVAPNGAGKSTLMRLLAKHEAPDAGSGTLLGRPYDEALGSRALDVAYVSEAIHYATRMSLREVFARIASFYPRWDQARLDVVAQGFGLDLSQKHTQVSRGQKMQAAFCAAIATRPRLLLIDEITAVLDPAARRVCVDEIRRLVGEGCTVVLATNITTEVEAEAHARLQLVAGKVAA